MKKNKMSHKYIQLKHLNKYFPKIIDINLLVCSKECSHVYLGTSKFKHICDKCNIEFKSLFNLKYKICEKKFLKREDKYEKMQILFGNQDETINWIDDITYDDLVSGEVDCIGNIDEIYIALVVCNNECQNFQLIVDGSPQICPKCGSQMFRVKTKKYKLMK